ncbi:hypothetical protein [Halosimplex pelagicum]|uniref:Uncharacterized protein n=1 Tax=Halosimplex pelagicum TaxID=869886 RepID=A0A7D5P990_9EURY|nr:hypothetical protein [Halosimplex pelagicum]QLH81984.1 hypothetical protein HZS54_10290 [Halosimplex pelagicum]
MVEDTELEDHSEVAYTVLQILEDLVEKVGERNCTAHFEAVLNDGHYFKGDPLGQKPERFIEEHLIHPMIQGLGHTIRTQPVQYAPKWKHGRGIPDFCLTTIPVQESKDLGLRLFGESKPPNKIEWARKQVKEYLEKDLDFHAVAVLTDGFEWELWVRPLDGSPELYNYTDLRPVLREVKKLNLEEEGYQPYTVRNSIDDGVFEDFTASALNGIVQQEFDLEVSV